MLQVMQIQPTLASSRNFSISGDVTSDSTQSFNGSGNVTIPVTLANSGVSHQLMVMQTVLHR